MSNKCVFCEWYVQDPIDIEMMCICSDSEFYGELTNYDDTCSSFKPEKEEGYYEREAAGSSI